MHVKWLPKPHFRKNFDFSNESVITNVILHFIKIKKKRKKNVNFGCTKATKPFTNTKGSLEEIDSDRSVYMAAVLYWSELNNFFTDFIISLDNDPFWVSWRYLVKWISFPCKSLIPIVQFVWHSIYAIVVHSDKWAASWWEMVIY